MLEAFGVQIVSSSGLFHSSTHFGRGEVTVSRESAACLILLMVFKVLFKVA